MKKIIALLFAAAVMFSFAGCESERSGDEKVKYDGELFGPVKIAENVEDVWIGLNTGFVNFFKDSDRENPSQSFTTSGFDDVANSMKSITSEDVNFDGYSDVVIPFHRYDDFQFYYVYIWDKDNASFSYYPQLSGVGNLAVGDGFLSGIANEHGAYFETKYFWEDGKLISEEESDENMHLAKEYTEGLLGKEGLNVSFSRDELIDMTISKLYFVSDAEGVIAYAAVSCDNSRVFYSPLTDVYFEVERDDDGYKKGLSYSKLPYSGVPNGYSAEAFSSLDASQKDYYDMIGEKLGSFDEISFESPDAAAAMEAYLKDHPVWYCCFIPKISGYSVTGSYCYTWSNYSDDVSVEVLSEKMKEYSDKINGYVSEMPTGLQPIERYVYLAQKLRLLAEEEHHHGSDADAMGLYIPGDSLNERAAKTFTYMCEKAELYCVWDGDYNYILDGAEKKRIAVYDTFAFVPGSDEWLNAFWAGE